MQSAAPAPDVHAAALAHRWPRRLWIVRHGESAGNVARDAAEQGGELRIDIAYRDVDTPLSALGEQQAAALAHWFAQAPEDERPTVVLASPYVRALATARAIVDRCGELIEDPRVHADERLREKEFGILDRWTVKGIAHAHPDLAAQRRHVGKFYFRPPGGESWCDVIQRLRSFVDCMRQDHPGERVLIVAHQVIVNCFRYLLEHLDEHAILAIDRAADVPNCAVTTYAFDPALGKRGGMQLVAANFVAPLVASHTPITTEPDLPVAPKA
ncbi:MAG: histidine phosphatase family protein [Burkholderiales bacterium]